MATISETLSAAARLVADGELDQAEQISRTIVTEDAHQAEAWRLLGVIALKKNNPAQGIALLNRSLSCDQGNAETWMSLADYDRIVGNATSSLAKYAQALQLRPEYAEAHDRMGVVLWKLGRWQEALAAFERAVALKPNDPEIACHLGECLREMGQPDRAAEQYRQALRINPTQPGAAKGLGFALMQQGDLEEGITQLRASLKSQPNQAQVYHSLSQLAAEGWCELTPDELEGMQSIACSAKHPAFDRSQCAFALGLILHEQGEYDTAMGYYRLANDLKKKVLQAQGMQFDAARLEAMIDRIIATFDRSYFERAQGWGASSELPIFVVGMPRSGSTLVEQILASHPQVFGAGECGDLQLFMKRREPGAYVDPYSMPFVNSREATQKLASDYLDWVRGLHPTATRIVNKTLHNFLHLGALTTLFPRARIIHCRRDPLDACLSCYFTNFKIVDFAWSLEDIGAYYRAYEKLMTHWASVLPATIKGVHYEELIGAPKLLSEDLIASCGLDWDDRCLEFYKTRRVVKTASADSSA